MTRLTPRLGGGGPGPGARGSGTRWPWPSTSTTIGGGTSGRGTETSGEYPAITKANESRTPKCGSTKNISCLPDNMCFIFSDLICYPMTMRSSPILPLYLHKEHCWQDLRWRILHFQTLSLSRNQFTISFHSKVISKEGGRRANKFLTFRGSYLHNCSGRWARVASPAPAPGTLVYGSHQDIRAVNVIPRMCSQ